MHGEKSHSLACMLVYLSAPNNSAYILWCRASYFFPPRLLYAPTTTQEDLRTWYNVLRKERVRAVGEEEKKFTELYGENASYMRQRARQASLSVKDGKEGSARRRSFAEMLHIGGKKGK